jgi:two-component sensor histidine kinase
VVTQPLPPFLDAIHPEDRPAVELVWHRSFTDGESFEIECWLVDHDGKDRWMLCRATPQKNGDGETVRWIGTFTDIDVAKRDRERIQLLRRELTHRIKNIFSIICALVDLSARDDPARRAWADALIGRIRALGRAHELSRPPEEGKRNTPIFHCASSSRISSAVSGQ